MMYEVDAEKAAPSFSVVARIFWMWKDAFGEGLAARVHSILQNLPIHAYPISIPADNTVDAIKN